MTTSDSIALYSEVIGQEHAPAFLILHGLFGSSRNWRSIAKKLALNYRVHLLDLRNHGQSPWSDTMSYVEMSGDVQRYIESNEIVFPTILGHSMGGKTVMTLLQSQAVRTKCSFIVDIAPVPYSHDHDQLIQAMQSLDLDSIVSRQQADLQLSKKVESLSVRQFLLQNLKRQDKSFQWQINLDVIAKQRSSLFDYSVNASLEAHSKGKTVFIRGTKSDYILPKYYDEIFNCFPNAEIESIENTGHWLHAEQPDALINLIAKHTN